MTNEPVYMSEPASFGTIAPIFNEAPAVIFTQLYTVREGQIVQFNITVRAEDGKRAIDQLIDAIAYAKEKYKLSVVRPDLSQPLQAAPARPASPAEQLPPAAAPIRPAPASAGAANVKPGNSNVIRAAKMKVTPQAGDKIKIEWMSTGHNFPDIYATKSCEQWLNLLPASEGWDASYLSKIGEYTVTHAISWVESDKLNSSGRPYKNISTIISG